MKFRYGLLPIVIMVWFKFSLLASMAPIEGTLYSGTCGFIYITDKFTEKYWKIPAARIPSFTNKWFRKTG